VQRYIWLARLNDGLLQMLDNKQLGLVQGVSISSLGEEEQEMVHRVLQRLKVKLSTTQAATIKQLGIDGKLTEETLIHYLQSAGKENVAKKLAISRDRLENYFAPEYSEQQMTEVIFRLLEEWKQRQSESENEERRVPE
jgi:ParB family chromosome partitioning protein